MCSTKPSSCLLALSPVPPHGVNLGWGNQLTPPADRGLPSIAGGGSTAVWSCRGLLLWLREPPRGESCDQGPALCHRSLVHPGPSTQRAGELPPQQRVGFFGGDNGHAYPHGSAPQERVQADDLVKMLFGTEEGDLLREPEPEQEPPAAVAVGKDEL